MKCPFLLASTAIAVVLCLAGPAFPGVDGVPEIPHEAAKLNHRGLDHLQKKEYDQAIENFRAALKIQPEYPDALDNLGKALEATGKDEEAIADFEAAMERHVDGYVCEWKAVLDDPDKLARFVSFVNAPGAPDPTVEFTEKNGRKVPVLIGTPTLRNR